MRKARKARPSRPGGVPDAEGSTGRLSMAPLADLVEPRYRKSPFSCNPQHAGKRSGRVVPGRLQRGRRVAPDYGRSGEPSCRDGTHQFLTVRGLFCRSIERVAPARGATAGGAGDASSRGDGVRTCRRGMPRTTTNDRRSRPRRIVDPRNVHDVDLRRMTSEIVRRACRSWRAGSRAQFCSVSG
jgi:hypothetical protein